MRVLVVTIGWLLFIGGIASVRTPRSMPLSEPELSRKLALPEAMRTQTLETVSVPSDKFGYVAAALGVTVMYLGISVRGLSVPKPHNKPLPFRGR